MCGRYSTINPVAQTLAISFCLFFFFSPKNGKCKVHLAMCSATVTSRNDISTEPGTSFSSEMSNN